MIQIIIDTKNGMGGKDYSSVVMFERGATVERRLNEPSTFKWFMLLTPDFDVPAVGATVNVVDSDGYILFAGNIYTCPTYARLGEGVDGPGWTVVCIAHSADATFSFDPSICGTKLFHASGESAWNTLLNAFPGASCQPVVSAESIPCARLRIGAGVTWADAAGTLATSSLSAYRLQGDQLLVVPYGQTTHNLSLDTPGLEVKLLTPTKMMITPTSIVMTGMDEPSAYVHHVVQGDGTSSTFKLLLARYKGTAEQRIVFEDLFAGSTVDMRHWAVSDPAAHIVLDQYGLSCRGGSGKDAGSVIASRNPLELCGSIVVEAHGVSIKSGSAGQVLGLYTGGVSMDNCFAAFQVNAVGTNVSVQAVVNGVLCGSSLMLAVEHVYLFRIRFNFFEAQRVYQSYVDVSGGSPTIHGGNDLAAGGRLFMEVEDVTSGISTAVVSLVAESIAQVPVSCVIGVYNNVDLTCSIASVKYAQGAPLEVFQTSPGVNGFVDQPTGLVSSGARCHVTSSDELVYYPGYVPPANALIRVMYRSQQRAIAIVSLAGDEGTSLVRNTLAASVKHPEALSSIDCFNAARAIKACFESQASFVSGTYAGVMECNGTSDIWPGDIFAISSAPNQTGYKGLVQEVKLALQGTKPVEVKGTVSFTHKLDVVSGIVTEPSIPANAIVPACISSDEVAGLSTGNLMVTNVDGQTIQIDTGVDAPVNGGFEVRYRDETFGPTNDSNLVMRTSTRNISLPRQSASETYHIRMYDGLAPRNYSQFSASLVIDVPLQS